MERGCGGGGGAERRGAARRDGGSGGNSVECVRSLGVYSANHGQLAGSTFKPLARNEFAFTICFSVERRSVNQSVNSISGTLDRGLLNLSIE